MCHLINPCIVCDCAQCHTDHFLGEWTFECVLTTYSYKHNDGAEGHACFSIVNTQSQSGLWEGGRCLRMGSPHPCLANER